MLILAMAMAMMIGMTMTVNAVTDYYQIWVSGTQVNSGNAGNVLGDGTVSYNNANKTLTLNGCNITGGYEFEASECAAIYADQELTIDLVGKNTAIHNPGSNKNSFGIKCKGDLTIKGDGELNTVSTTDYGNGISVSGVEFCIKGGTVNTAGNYNSAIDGNNITISDGTVNANGGIFGDVVKISGGKVTAEENGIAINCNTINISGGTVIAKENENPKDKIDGDQYYGISGYDGVTITGGEVTAESNCGGGIISGYDDNGNGINEPGDYDVTGKVTIESGTVTTSGYLHGICSECNGDVNIKADTVIASGGEAAINGTVKNDIAGTGWTDVDGTKGRAAIPVSTTGHKLTYKKAQFPTAPYSLWIGGVQVTNENASDVFNDGKVSYTPATTGENPTPATLTLNGYSYSGEGHLYYDETILMNLYSAIQYDGQDPLTILLKGENSLTCTGEDSLDKIYFGIRSKGGVTIDGTGSIAVSALQTGIQIGNGDAPYDLDIEGGSVSVNVEKGSPIEVYGDVVIGEKAGTVNVESSGKNDTSVTIYGEKGLFVNGGTVKIAAYGENGKAVFVRNSAFITIGKNVTNFTAIGGNCVFAAEKKAKNAIPGTGWTDVAGTKGEATIAVNETGQDLSAYKKVQFPPTPAPTPAKKVTTVTVNAKTVNAKAVTSAVAKAGGKASTIETIILGKNVKKISAKAFTGFNNAKTLVVKTKKLKKKSVKGSLKGSKVTKVKVSVGKKKVNKKFVKKYKKIFTKKNAGKKAKVAL